MRPWRTRLALRRSRVQSALLGVVLLVSLLSATLLTTLFLLADATETFAARASLTEADEQDVRVVVRVAADAPVDEVVEAAGTSVAALLGSVPATRGVHAQSDLLSLPDDADELTLTYLASMDGVDGQVTLVDGSLPDSQEALIPQSLAEVRGLEPGDPLPIAGVFGVDEHPTLTVAGVYTVDAPATDFWRFDRFQGAAHDPATPLPYSGGRVVADGYGPLLTDAATVSTYPLGDVTITHVPDFSQVSLAQTQALLNRLDVLERETIAGVGVAGDDVRVSTHLDATLGHTIGALAVTRSSILVTGLLLLVLAVAALAQTTRLIGERRQSEQALMVARGASGRQLLGLGLIEALVVGALTAAAAPFLARASYRALAARDAMERAGMDQDPGIPAGAWVVAAAVGLTLVAVMVAPLLKRSASLLEAESAQARPRRAAALQRGGIDIALLVLAGLAYWQLRSYESPVVTEGGVARLDPLLAAGPALALLAGALIAARLIPAASRLLEGLASRGRGAVMPLAAWEVGRRSARAVSAVLLLTLAVSVGTFAMSYLATWQTSQDHQAQYRHPADAVVTGLAGGAAAQAAAVAGGGATGAAPVLDRTIVVSTQTEPSVTDQDLSGLSVHLVASTADGLAVLAQGRAGQEGAARIPAALADEPAQGQVREGITLPADAQGLALTVTPSTSPTALTDILVTVRGVLTDANGDMATVDLGTLPVDGEPHDLEVFAAAEDELADLALPLTLTGLQTVWLSTAGEQVDAGAVSGEGALTLRLSVDGITGLHLDRPAQDAAEAEGDEAPAVTRTPVETVLEDPWYAREYDVDIATLAPDDDQIHVEMRTSAPLLRFRPAALALTAQPSAGKVAVALTDGLASRLRLTEGDDVLIEVDGTALLATVAGTAPLLPDENPREDAVIADLDQLQLALVQAAAPTTTPDEWWIAIADERLDAYADTLPEAATMTSQAAEAIALKEDPLRVATQAALWLVTAAAVVLAAVGFAVHAVVTVRARRTELAQLRAVGLGRSQLQRVIGAESLLLTALGVGFGLGLGIALAYLVGPLVAVGTDGRPPLPSVLVEVPWSTVVLLAVEAALVLAVSTVIVGALLRRIDPAQELRRGSE